MESKGHSVLPSPSKKKIPKIIAQQKKIQTAHASFSLTPKLTDFRFIKEGRKQYLTKSSTCIIFRTKQ